MADKRIDELEEATSMTGTDLFVLEQANTAKKLTGQTMTNFLLALANGHGGISSIDKTSSSATDPVVDTYTITVADQTTTTFEVTNGAKGDTGARGPQGPKGDDATITSTSVMYQAWPSGTQYPTGTWVDNPPAVTPGNYLWTRTIVNYSDGDQTVSYSVARWGIDGSGAVASVNGNLPDQNGNVALTASDVGALPDSYQAPVTSVNGATGAVDLGAADVGAVPGLSVSATRSAAGWYRVMTHAGAFPDGSIIKFKIGRNQNGECHEIDLLVPHDEAFMNETSKTGTDFGVTKIRVTADANNRHVDVYMAMSVSSLLSVAFEPSGTITQTNVTAGTLQAVAYAPSGETVLSTYELNANTEGVTDGWHYTLQGKHIRAKKIITQTLSNYTTINNFFGYYIPDITTPFTMANAQYYIGATWSIGSGFGFSAGILAQTTTKFNAYALATASGSQDIQLTIFIDGEIA